MFGDLLKEVAERKMLLEVENAGQDWIRLNKDEVDRFLSTRGALLIRGFKIDSSEQLADVLTGFFGEPLSAYTYRSTPRKQLVNNVYTATEYHSTEEIPQHNENAYSNFWPMRIGFLCVIPPAAGGKTPISDSRTVYMEIPREIREEFEKKKLMYVRNYSSIDLSWKEVFQTNDKAAVEAYCGKNDVAFEWLPGGCLRTKQINQASAVHPVSREKLWFNQAHLFHISSLKQELREDLINLVGEDGLPRNVFFGDGTPIDDQLLQVIRNIYDKTKFTFQWEKNDLLLLDNMLFTHGRESFEGPRQILVGMAREYSLTGKEVLV